MKKASIIIIALLLAGCGPAEWDRINAMPPAQLAQLSDLQICIAETHLVYFSEAFSPTFLSEYQKRGVICDDSGAWIRVAGYTQERLDADDDATCRSYGAKPKTKTYIDCRLQLRAQHQDAYQAQQANQIQRDEAQAAAYQNLTNTGVQMMQQSQQAQPSVTTCSSMRNNINCVTP